MNRVLEACNHEMSATVLSGMVALGIGTAVDTFFPFHDDDDNMTDALAFAAHLATTGMAVLMWDSIARTDGNNMEGLCSGGVFFTVLLASQPSMNQRIQNLNKELSKEWLMPTWTMLMQGVSQARSAWNAIPRANTTPATQQQTNPNYASSS